MLYAYTQAVQAAGGDLTSTATNAKTVLGAVVVALVLTVMAWRMFVAYANDDYVRLALAAVVGLVVVWFIQSSTGALGLVITTANKVVSG